MSQRNAVIAVFLALALPVLAAPVLAKPDLKMSIVAEKEIKVEENGKTVVKRVPATDTVAGEVLFYTLTYSNAGDEKATAVKVDNPLPQGVKYVAESASGAGADVSFSVDGGKSFAKPAQLTVEKVKAGKKEKVKAEAVDYTTIRWVITEVKPGQTGQLGFHAQVQ
ncbi:MAG: hypothetical protein Q8J78_03440 [Moraxellaceae bacterium]|nr:hypothetical protein [Moraxellaceae bacterium]